MSYIPTNLTYKITTIEELYDVITKENIDYILKDLRNWITTGKQFEEEYKDCNAKINPVFNWTDDGKFDVNIRVNLKDDK